MSKTGQATSGGIGFSGLLCLVFVVAKLWDRIDWSWWWVCSPLWIPAGVALGIVAVCLVFAGLCYSLAGLVAIASLAARRLRGRRDNDV